LSEATIFLRETVTVSNNFDIYAFEYLSVSAQIQ